MRREIERWGGSVRDWGENMIKIYYKKNIVKQKVIKIIHHAYFLEYGIGN